MKLKIMIGSDVPKELCNDQGMLQDVEGIMKSIHPEITYEDLKEWPCDGYFMNLKSAELLGMFLKLVLLRTDGKVTLLLPSNQGYSFKVLLYP